MQRSLPYPRPWLPIVILAIGLVAVTACAGPTGSSPGARSIAPSGPASAAPSSSPSSASVESASAAPASDTPAPSPSDSEPPDAGGGTTSGDVPDDAVFLTYRGPNPAFTIQYVEGWQVTPRPDGVVIRDKDSSETVAIVAAQADVPGYVAMTDLPALQALPGYRPGKQNSVTIRGTRYLHLVYHAPAPPDPVTGKRVPSTVDRYYVPGPNGLAIVSLSTPDGVDNVDAFRQMIESFRWS